MMNMRLTIGVITLLLCLLHIIILAGYTTLCAKVGHCPLFPLAGFWAVLLSATALSIAMLLGRFRRHSTLLAVTNVVNAVVLAGVFVWFLQDSPPLKEDITDADLRCTANDSYASLSVFFSDEKRKAIEPLLELDNELDGTQAAEEALIKKQWAAIADYRAALEALDNYQTICDLPPDVHFGADTPLGSFWALSKTADIYNKYAALVLKQGRPEEALDHLTRLYSVSRKGLAAGSILINKMIFTALAERTLNAAYAMLETNRWTQQDLARLEEFFLPLEPAEYAMERAFKGEYLFMKNTMQAIKPDNFLDTVSLEDNTKQSGGSISSWITYHAGFKPNMNARYLKGLCDRMIAAQSKVPPDFGEVQRYTDAYTRKPQYRNMAGWILNTIAAPSLETYTRRTVNLKVKSDLLAAAIAQKRNQPDDVRDYFTGAPLRVHREKGALRHPGPDGAYDSDDDILLGKTEK